MKDTSRFEFQKLMFVKGAEELQRHISRLDEILFKIKASGVTVWVALIGWSFASKNTLMIPLGAVVIIGFWLLEGFFRGIQARYVDRSTELTRLLNDRKTLDSYFESQEFPSNVVYPMAFHESQIRKLKMYGRGLIAPSVATLYLFLAFVNYLLWLVVKISI